MGVLLIDPSATHLVALSLHDALPIYLFAIRREIAGHESPSINRAYLFACLVVNTQDGCRPTSANESELSITRSEEHTSELQSRRDLVCRILLEKKKGSRRIGQSSRSQ